MNQPRMNPAVLRLLVIFPNVLSYMLLFGIVVYIITNYSYLVESGAIKTWGIIVAVLAPMAGYTTYTIVKKMKLGAM